MKFGRGICYIIAFLILNSCKQFDAKHFILDKNENGEIHHSLINEPADTLVTGINIGEIRDLNLDNDPESIIDLKLMASYLISGGGIKQWFLTCSGGQLFISAESHVDTFCAYTVYPNATDTFTYNVSYHSDVIYPPGHSIYTYEYVYVKRHSLGEMIDLTNLNFVSASSVNYLHYSDHSHYSENNLEQYFDIERGIWYGKGRGCLIFKFQDAHGKTYYGWIELDVIEYKKFIFYAFYTYLE